jgi:hypothetical protein
VTTTEDQESDMEQDTPTVAEPDSAPAEPAAAVAATKRLSVLKGVGIVATGLIAGAIGVATISGSSSASTTPQGPGAAVQNGQGFRGGPPGSFGGGPGGRAGETRAVGTLSAVGASSITVKTTAGASTTVPIGSSTAIVRDGVRTTLSALKVGDQVVVHFPPHGSSTVVEVVLAGTSATAGPGGFGGPPPGVQDQQAPTGSNT